MKKIFLLLFSLFVGLLTFCNAEFFPGDRSTRITIYQNGTFNGTCNGLCCFSSPINDATVRQGLVISYNGNSYNLYDTGSSNQADLGCFLISGSFTILNSSSEGVYVYPFYMGSLLNVCETCSEVDTGAILSGSCDTNYCVENDLCPVPSNFSQLFINDIEFPSKPLINVFIPDYIYWDYSSSDSGYDINVGSGYDQNYIDSVLKINSYRPDSSDFTNIFVSGLTLLFPYLIFALFLVFMRKLIKRIFKH